MSASAIVQNQSHPLSQSASDVDVVQPPLALGINVEKPKFPQYAVYFKRLESFDAWPEHIPVRKEDLVEAGLVYTGVGDSVRCYFCGGGLRNWERDDVPMEKHAKWYPKCPYIMLVKGQNYVEKLIRGVRPDEDGRQSQSDANHMPESDALESIPAQSCLQMGYSKEIVKKAIDIYRNRHGNNDYRAKDLGEIILDLEDEAVNQDTNLDQQTNDYRNSTDCNESFDQLIEENRQLKEKTMCKICMDSESSVTYLPCGHMMSCEMCASSITHCPICRMPVTEKLKYQEDSKTGCRNYFISTLWK